MTHSTNPSDTNQKDPTHAAFFIKTDLSEKSVFFYGAYTDKGLALVETNELVLLKDKDSAFEQNEKKYGKGNVLYLGTTRPTYPNLIGIKHYSDLDKVVMKMELDKKYRPEEYKFQLLEEAKNEALPDRRDELLDRAEDLDFLPHPLLMTFLNNRRMEEENELRTIDRFEAEEIFKKLAIMDYYQEAAEANLSREDINKMRRIDTQRNDM